MTCRPAVLRLTIVLAVLAIAACRPTRRPAAGGGTRAPEPVATAVSDVATGGSWEEGGRSGVHRIVVRGAGGRDVRSAAELQWLEWREGQEQPVVIRAVVVEEIGRRGIVVTKSRVEEEDGRTVVRLGIANAVTGAVGEARIWPTGLGTYRARVKWADDALSQ